MRFVTGARARSVKYVVRPSRTVNDLSTGLSTNTPPLRIEFKEHKWDSESVGAQRMFEEYSFWTENTRNPKTPEEVQEMCEQYLQRHGDWNRGDGTGIFLDQSANQKTVTASHAVEVGMSGSPRTERCLHFKEVAGETIQCGNPAVADDENQLCAVHAAEAEAAEEPVSV